MDISSILEGTTDPPILPRSLSPCLPSCCSLPRLDMSSAHIYTSQKPVLTSLQPNISHSLFDQFQPPTFSSQSLNSQLPPDHQQHSQSTPSLARGTTVHGSANERPTPSNSRSLKSSAKNKQFKWSCEGDATII
ncbi:hypothetical protein E4T44_07115 [Aureobasidium sp. EXF-8845]|nr:hypothetical protein E4T44_07115 [Aureobasidium sp. EXF-8845]KAI4843183.1 hypothetical protein E4T45_08732 [Aureobasidium sp. EXF-8846]